MENTNKRLIIAWSIIPAILTACLYMLFDRENVDSALAVLFVGIFALIVIYPIYFSLMSAYFVIKKNCPFRFCAYTYILMSILSNIIFIVILGFTTGGYRPMILWVSPFCLASLALTGLGLVIVYLVQKRKNKATESSSSRS